MANTMYAPSEAQQGRHPRRRQPRPRRPLWPQVLARTLVAASACLLLAATSITPVSASSRPQNLHAPRADLFSPPSSGSNANSPLSPSSLASSSSSSAAESTLDMCRLTGKIDDASCDYESVERLLNSGDLFDKLESLVATKYFRYYKVDLFKDCPFWVENGLCMSRSCGVEKADESDVPEEYRASRLSSVETAPSSDVFPEQSSGESSTCACSSTDFCHWEDEEWSSEASWVDLKQNPERFTGYAGPSANRVWRTIYEENCFGAVPKGSLATRGNLIASQGAGLSTPAGPGGFGASSFAFGAGLTDPAGPPLDPTSSEQCLEKRVFYRIISGLHASISIHVCAEYLDQKTGEWAPNLDCFLERIAEHPERLQNVYFNYVLLTRALARAGDYLVASQQKPGVGGPAMRKGDSIAEPETAALLQELITRANENPATFDEGKMFDASVNPEAPQLKEEFRDRFLNISRIMDCVGCDRCRLWGKLQVNGLGTALKILFGVEEKELDPRSNPDLLQRSELVALINTIHRFAESLRAVETFRRLYLERMSAKNTEGGVSSHADISGGTGSVGARGRGGKGEDVSRPAKPSTPIKAQGASCSSSSSLSSTMSKAEEAQSRLQTLQLRATAGLTRLASACQHSLTACLQRTNQALISLGLFPFSRHGETATATDRSNAVSGLKNEL